MKGTRAPLHPAHPERTCWGCDKYCPADDLACGNGTIRTLHPVELFGDDWLEWFSRHDPPTSAAGSSDGQRDAGEGAATFPCEQRDEAVHSANRHRAA